MRHPADKTILCQKKNPENHIGQVADCGIGKTPLKMPLLKRHRRPENAGEGSRAKAEILNPGSGDVSRPVRIPGQAHDRENAGVHDSNGMQKRCDRCRGNRRLRKPAMKWEKRGFYPETEKSEKINQLQKGLFVEVFVDDDDGGHIETKKIWSCRYTDSIFDTDWTTYQGPKKGFNFKY